MKKRKREKITVIVCIAVHMYNYNIMPEQYLHEHAHKIHKPLCSNIQHILAIWNRSFTETRGDRYTDIILGPSKHNPKLCYKMAIFYHTLHSLECGQTCQTWRSHRVLWAAGEILTQRQSCSARSYTAGPHQGPVMNRRGSTRSPPWAWPYSNITSIHKQPFTGLILENGTWGKWQREPNPQY